MVVLIVSDIKKTFFRWSQKHKIWYGLRNGLVFIGSHNMIRRKPIYCHVVLLGHNELQISVPQRDVLWNGDNEE